MPEVSAFFPAFKPFLSALVLPPVPLLLLALVGARCATGRRRALGFVMVLLSCIGLWLSGCNGAAALLQDHLVKPPPALSAAERARLTQLGRTQPHNVAIWVLGGGRHAKAPEYGNEANLTQQSLVRLRYGVWLARNTGLPLGFTGGVGWAQTDELSEAEIAARIAQQDWGITMRWKEAGSRDTRENAALSLPLLRAAGVQEVVLVTHAAHMPRALRAFRDAASAQAGEPLRVTAAPVSFVIADEDRWPLQWLPSPGGFQNVYNLLHEWVGYVTGH
jgi:uncharacterized SAM-binding protein YcdF (DUF218 family)